jgi:hypothetical protein
MSIRQLAMALRTYDAVTSDVDRLALEEAPERTRRIAKQTRNRAILDLVRAARYVIVNHDRQRASKAGAA